MHPQGCDGAGAPDRYHAGSGALRRSCALPGDPAVITGPVRREGRSTTVRYEQVDARLRERGASAVEFAILVPVLVMILFGIIYFSLYFNARQGVQAAAREGARAGAIVSGQGCEAARQQLSNFSSSAISCTETRDCAATGSRVQVHVVETVSVPLLGNRDVTLDSSSVYACQA